MNQSKGTILIADDKKIVREPLMAYLAMDFPDYNVIEVTSGMNLERRLKEGLENTPLVILDNHMPPGPFGSELIKQYAAKYNGGTSFILFYGDDDDSIGEQAVRDGAVAFYKKPGDMNVIMGKAKEVIGNNS